MSSSFSFHDDEWKEPDTFLMSRLHLHACLTLLKQSKIFETVYYFGLDADRAVVGAISPLKRNQERNGNSCRTVRLTTDRVNLETVLKFVHDKYVSDL